MTRITGRASAIGAIRTGDTVAVEITRSGGNGTAIAIADPPGAILP